jgi:hypothetical protein
MLFPLQVMEGDEQAKAWVALDESTPSPLPFQRRVIYESPEDDPLLVYGFQINLLSYQMVVESSMVQFPQRKTISCIQSLPPLHKG